MGKDMANYDPLFFYSPIPKWVYDVMTFEILDVNKAAIRHYGYSRKEFLNMTVKDLRPESEIPKMLESHSKSILRKESFYIGKFIHLKKNKEKILVEVHGHKLNYKGHEAIMVVCIDVTEKDRQWDELKKSEKRLKAASSIAQLGYWRYEMDSSELIWSDEVYKIWKQRKSGFKLDLDYFISTIHPEDRDEFELRQGLMYAGIKNLNFVHRIVLPDKSVKWVHEIGRIESDDSGRVIAIEGTVQDITSQKTEEQRLKLLESVITNTNDAILITEAEPVDGINHRIVYLNQAFCKMTGYQLHELIGQSPKILQGPKSDFKELERLSKSLKKWESCEVTTINYKKSGEEFWVNFTVSPVANEKGWYTHWIAIERDVTKRKNRELEQNLLSQISRIFNQENGLVSACNKLCRAFADFGEFDFVEVWLPNLENTFIKLISYSEYTPAANEFYRLSKQYKLFEFGDGIPGNVWKTKQILTWSDLERQERFVRMNAALEAGIASIIGVPLTFKESLVGVLVFGSGKNIDQLSRYLKILPRLESFIGSEINRKSLESNLSHLFEEKTNIIESIADAFFTVDSNFIVTYWNHTAENLLGVKREDLIGKNLWEVFPDAVHLPSYTNYHKVLETGMPISFEDYYGFWIEVNAYPSEDGLTVFFRDISFRKEAEENLRRAYEERNQILESIGDAFFAVDHDWKVTYWNRMAEEVLLKPKNEIVGRYLWTEYADAIDSDFYRMYHKAVESGEIISFEEYYPTQQKWFEVTAYPSQNGLSVYFKDITFRKEIDFRLLEANERFEKVAEATNEAIWDWNIVNSTIFRGKGFTTLFGLDSTGTNLELEAWSNHINVEDRDRVLSTINAAISDPDIRIWEEEYRYEKGDGKYAYVLDRGIVIRDKQGKPVRMVGAMQDISYRKEYEQHLKTLNAALNKNISELEIANEELEQFAFITSHDLQEPLRMITSFLNQLERKYADKLDDKARQYIGFATDGAVRMKQIILDLLEFSRAGKLSENIHELDLEEIIDQYKLLRSRLIQEKSVDLVYSKLPRVTAFAVPLTQTIHCLLDNAIKYSKDSEKPIIKLNVSEEKMQWLFSIEDNGIGIEEEYFEKIFVIFQRLHNRTEYSGTGMGLSIVKKNVESWGGKVWLESEIGVGSTFYFTVPKLKSE